MASIVNRTIPIIKIQEAVLDWYRANGRHGLPWRNLEKYGVNIAYGIMVSEFMLQQTQVERVIPKFTAFIKYFPTIPSLARVSPARVITLWSGLGYNRRAVMLHNAAKAIVTHHKGSVPSSLDELEALPGIGTYTASAIMAFAYNQPVAVLDTNIVRFYELLFWGHVLPKPAEQREFVATFVPRTQSKEWHSALMDLMSIVRKAKTPAEQQELLLKLLKLKPSWKLPVLTVKPLHRAKQTTFVASKRYYRGRIIAHLRDLPKHKSTFSQIHRVLKDNKMPTEYNGEELLLGLKKDGLVIFNEPLKPRTIIRLP